MEITYNNIKPLIIKENIEGNQIQLKFKAQNQATPLTTIAVVVPNTKDIAKNVGKEMVKSTVKRSILNSVLRTIGLGGILGSVIRQTVNETVRNNSSHNIVDTKISEQDKQNAIVDAFKPFAAMYKYNNESSEWEYQQ